MSTETKLKAELRAAKEELIRASRSHPEEGGPVAPPSDRFPWLQTLSKSELNSHIQRLERDLAEFNSSEYPIWNTHSGLSQLSVQTKLSEFGT